MNTQIIAVANQKGGVGKTTTTLNLGAGLVKAGQKVLLVDLDPQGSLSACLDHQQDNRPTTADLITAVVNNQSVPIVEAIRNNKDGIDYIASNILLSGADTILLLAICREQVLKRILRHESLAIYDYILIDCLPSLGVLLTNALTAANSIIIPVQTEELALLGIEQLEWTCELVKSNLNPDLTIIGVLPTMCNNSNMSKAVEEALRQRFPDTLFRTHISDSVAAANSTYAKKSLVAIKNSKLGAQYSDVVAELLERRSQ